MLALVTLLGCIVRPGDTAEARDAPDRVELAELSHLVAAVEADEFPKENDGPRELHVDDAKEPEAVKEKPWTEEELQAVALTLAGECYEDKVHDKRLVCEVILNRVGQAEFGYTVLEVLTKPYAFNGYWRQSRPVSENDLAVAEQALQDWYDGGCKPLSEWLFFSAGPDRENVFRTEF